MSSEQSSQTRSEKPTPKKLLDSRNKGQVVRSRELNTTVMMLAASIGLFFLGGEMGRSLLKLLESDLQIGRGVELSEELMISRLEGSVVESLIILLPYLVLMLISAFFGPLILGGWSFSSESWKPKLSRMNPLSGIKRMFGTQGLVEMFKALGKFVIVAIVALVAIRFYHERILTLGAVPVIDAVSIGFSIVGQLFILLALSLILVSLIDVPYQILSHVNRLKMSIQEIREENKQTNGNPELKTRIRQMQREVSQRRMLRDVAEADVVIVNPIHFSVGLKYDNTKTGAPVVVAKGVDSMAMRIREIANGNNVAIFEAPPLARALYHHTEIGQEVPSELYHAVAQVLAYVYQIRDMTVTETLTVERPTTISIPPEFVLDNEDDTVGSSS